MVYLSIEDDTKDFYLFINSPGGWVIPGVAIYDTMQFVRPDVHTICMGVMIHQPASSSYEAQTGEFLLRSGRTIKIARNPHKGYVISKDLESDVFMSAIEAQAHGIVVLVAVE
ncbi:ATP-dependent Clp protease proteolytic subunit [Bienertia sinuspersici]